MTFRNRALKAPQPSPGTPAAAGSNPPTNRHASKSPQGLTRGFLKHSKLAAIVGSKNLIKSSMMQTKVNRERQAILSERAVKKSTGLNFTQLSAISSSFKLVFSPFTAAKSTAAAVGSLEAQDTLSLAPTSTSASSTKQKNGFKPSTKFLKAVKLIDRLVSTTAGRDRLAAALAIDWSQNGLPIDPNTVTTGSKRKAIQRAIQEALSAISKLKPSRRANPNTATAASSEDLDNDVSGGTCYDLPSTPVSKAALFIFYRVVTASPGLEHDLQISANPAGPRTNSQTSLSTTSIVNEAAEEEEEEETVAVAAVAESEAEPPLTPRSKWGDLAFRLQSTYFVNHWNYIDTTLAAHGPAPTDAVYSPLRDAAAVQELKRRLVHVPVARLVAVLAAPPHVARYIWLGQRDAAQRAAARALGAKAHRARGRAGAKADHRMRKIEEEAELERLDEEAVIFDSTVDPIPATPVKKTKKAVKAMQTAGKGLSNIGAALKKGVAAVKPAALVAKAKESLAEGKERRADAKAAKKMAAFVSAVETISSAASATAAAAAPVVEIPATAAAAAADAKPRRGLGKLAAGLRKGREAAKTKVRALAAALSKVAAKKDKMSAKLATSAPAAAATPVPSPSKLAILASPAAAFPEDEPASPSFSIPAVRPSAARALVF